MSSSSNIGDTWARVKVWYLVPNKIRWSIFQMTLIKTCPLGLSSSTHPNLYRPIWYAPAPTDEVGGGLETPPAAMPTRSGVPHPKQRRGKPGGDLTDSFENREEGGRDLSRPSRCFSWSKLVGQKSPTSLVTFGIQLRSTTDFFTDKIETYASPSGARELPPLLQIQNIGTSAAFTW